MDIYYFPITDKSVTDKTEYRCYIGFSADIFLNKLSLKLFKNSGYTYFLLISFRFSFSVSKLVFSGRFSVKTLKTNVTINLVIDSMYIL